MLDGIRGIAIAAVLLFHAFFERIPHSAAEYAVRKAFAPLWMGVNVFFVLSGFLITGILIDTRGRPNYFRSFYARRILRIFPLYFLTLSCFFLVLPAFHLLPHSPVSSQLPYWTYTYNWSAALGYQVFGQMHLWSLSLEEQFYLLWPILLLLVPVRRLPVLFTALLASSSLFRLTLYFTGQPFTYAYFLTPSHVEDLCFGALAAFAVRHPLWLARVRRHLAHLAWSFAGLFLIAYAAGKGVEGNKWPALLYGTTAVCGLTALAVIESTTGTRGHWWGHPVLRWLGTYSYGIYILHQSVLNFANLRLAGSSFLTYSAAMLLAIAASCLAGWVSYFAFERYFLRLKRQFRPG